MISTAFSEVCLNMHITLYIKNYEYFYLHCSKLLLCVGIGLVNYILQEMVVEKEKQSSGVSHDGGTFAWAWLFCEWCTGRLHIVYIIYA